MCSVSLPPSYYNRLGLNNIASSDFKKNSPFVLNFANRRIAVRHIHTYSINIFTRDVNQHLYFSPCRLSYIHLYLYGLHIAIAFFEFYLTKSG